MTTYVPESQKCRAIAVFWTIFNLGGGVGSLASFGLNYHSKSGTVSNSTYIALMVIMLFGWLLSISSAPLACPPPATPARRRPRRVLPLLHQSRGPSHSPRTRYLAGPPHAPPLLLRECILLLPAERRQRHDLQHPYALPKRRALLDRPDVRRPPHGAPAGPLLSGPPAARSPRLARPLHYRNDHLGRGLRLPALGRPPRVGWPETRHRLHPGLPIYRSDVPIHLLRCI
jgi:hypothetical protein